MLIDQAIRPTATPVKSPVAQGASQVSTAAKEAIKAITQEPKDQNTIHKHSHGGAITSCPIFIEPRFSPEKLIESTLPKIKDNQDDNIVSLSDYFKKEKALEKFWGQLQEMTPDQLDDIKDYLMKRATGRETSQNDRDALMTLYKYVDAAAEGRPRPGGPRILNDIDIMPMPRPPYPIRPGHPVIHPFDLMKNVAAK